MHVNVIFYMSSTITYISKVKSFRNIVTQQKHRGEVPSTPSLYHCGVWLCLYLRGLGLSSLYKGLDFLRVWKILVTTANRPEIFIEFLLLSFKENTLLKHFDFTRKICRTLEHTYSRGLTLKIFSRKMCQQWSSKTGYKPSNKSAKKTNGSNLL